MRCRQLVVSCQFEVENVDGILGALDDFIGARGRPRNRIGERRTALDAQRRASVCKQWTSRQILQESAAARIRVARRDHQGPPIVVTLRSKPRRSVTRGLRHGTYSVGPPDFLLRRYKKSFLRSSLNIIMWPAL